MRAVLKEVIPTGRRPAGHLKIRRLAELPAHEPSTPPRPSLRRRSAGGETRLIGSRSSYHRTVVPRRVAADCIADGDTRRTMLKENRMAAGKTTK
jgi:hypothetical protein